MNNVRGLMMYHIFTFVDESSLCNRDINMCCTSSTMYISQVLHMYKKCRMLDIRNLLGHDWQFREIRSWRIVEIVGVFARPLTQVKIWLGYITVILCRNIYCCIFILCLRWPMPVLFVDNVEIILDYHHIQCYVSNCRHLNKLWSGLYQRTRVRSNTHTYARTHAPHTQSEYSNLAKSYRTGEIKLNVDA
jgi:hypothetical protein